MRPHHLTETRSTVVWKAWSSTIRFYKTCIICEEKHRKACTYEKSLDKLQLKNKSIIAQLPRSISLYSGKHVLFLERGGTFDTQVKKRIRWSLATWICFLQTENNLSLQISPLRKGMASGHSSPTPVPVICWDISSITCSSLNAIGRNAFSELIRTS